MSSCEPLLHICHLISWKPLEIEAWFQLRTDKRKWSMGHQIVTWPMTSPSSRDSERWNMWPQYA